MPDLKILVVEDDFLSRSGLMQKMSEFGTVDPATNGKEAVDLVRKSIQEKNPYDLVLLDIMMPVMDGQEALDEIRKLEEKSGILGSDGVKIIMTTALHDAGTIMQSFRNQCEAYVTKPYTRKQLVKQMQNIGLDVS